MARWLLCCAWALALASPVACAPAAGDSIDASEEAISRASLRPLDADELSIPLTKARIEGTHTLSADAFGKKWDASVADGAIMFYRAYPGAYHLDLKQLRRSRFPGEETVCVGDAHPDNFGFLDVDGDDGGRKTIYAFNDLDDSGSCLASVDALRYFTAFRLYFDDGGKLDESIDDYVDEVFGNGSTSPAATATKDADNEDAPDWKDVRKDVLRKYADGDAFRTFGDQSLVPVDAPIKPRVAAALGAGVTVHDVARRPRDAGGSGGLLRYWALATTADGERTVLELKETATPAVEHGHTRRALLGDARLTELKASLWDVTREGDYRYVELDGKTFLVRDRARKASVAPKAKHRKAQAVFLGRLHRDKWGRAQKRDVREWLHKSSKVIAKRWEKLFSASR